MCTAPIVFNSTRSPDAQIFGAKPLADCGGSGNVGFIMGMFFFFFFFFFFFIYIYIYINGFTNTNFNK